MLSLACWPCLNRTYWICGAIVVIPLSWGYLVWSLCTSLEFTGIHSSVLIILGWCSGGTLAYTYLAFHRDLALRVLGAILFALRDLWPNSLLGYFHFISVRVWSTFLVAPNYHSYSPKLVPVTFPAVAMCWKRRKHK